MKYNIIFILVLFLLIGCNQEKINYPTPVKPYYDGQLILEEGLFTIGDTDHPADYGMLTVSENRLGENSRFIHLPLIRVRSSSKKPKEPVFYFTGGPGMSNMNGLGLMWHLLPERDIVAVGFRGVDGSSVLNCPEIINAFKGESGLFSDSSMENISVAWSNCANRLKEEGTDINGYNILEVIQDNELAREALGYEKINLKSASYGTRIAYIYGLIHPDKIYRSAMIAVNPPGRFVWEPDVIDKQLHYFSMLASKDSLMSTKTDNLYRSISNAFKDIPDRWLIFPIDEGKVKVVAFSLLWKRNTAAMVFDALIDAENGDYSGLALMSMAYDFVMPEMMTWGDLASKAVSADYDTSRSYSTEMEPENLPLGAPMSKLFWGPIKEGTWPINSIPEKFKKPQDSDIETLLISGSIDLGTPADFAKDQLLPHLKNGKQIILSEYGHMDLEWPDPENTQLILSSFYNTGIPDTSLNKEVKIDFNVSWGFSQIMKISLLVFALLFLALIFFLRFIVKLFWVKIKNMKNLDVTDTGVNS